MMREHHAWAASCTPHRLGMEPTTQACALTGNRTVTSWFLGQRSAAEHRPGLQAPSPVCGVQEAAGPGFSLFMRVSLSPSLCLPL